MYTYLNDLVILKKVPTAFSKSSGGKVKQKLSSERGLMNAQNYEFSHRRNDVCLFVCDSDITRREAHAGE